jgi:hypothetical protein
MSSQTAKHKKEEVPTMRSIREIYEKREEGLYPCRYPRCHGYGNTASKHFGIVCGEHKVADCTLVPSLDPWLRVILDLEKNQLETTAMAKAS